MRERYIYTYEGEKVVIIYAGVADWLGLSTLCACENHKVLVSPKWCDLLDRENVDYELAYDDCYNGGYKGDREIFCAEFASARNNQYKVVDFVSADYYYEVEGKDQK
jgi:hypothetical protein